MKKKDLKVNSDLEGIDKVLNHNMAFIKVILLNSFWSVEPQHDLHKGNTTQQLLKCWTTTCTAIYYVSFNIEIAIPDFIWVYIKFEYWVLLDYLC